MGAGDGRDRLLRQGGGAQGWISPPVDADDQRLVGYRNTGYRCRSIRGGRRRVLKVVGKLAGVREAVEDLLNTSPSAVDSRRIVLGEFTIGAEAPLASAIDDQFTSPSAHIAALQRRDLAIGEAGGDQGQDQRVTAPE
jgi:hypothetical protein